jgi:hypothetical protein
MRRNERDVRAWLEQQPSLTELQEAYPQEWAVVQRELAELVPRGNVHELTAYVRQISAAGRKPVRGLDPALGAEIRRQMATAAIKQLSLSAATGVHEGRVRFNLVNGWVAQKLLFESGLRRKPVSLGAFRVVWPLLWQRRFLMPLVGPRGIYCFYSKPLVRRLVEMVDGRPALEIAAGDGTLSRFLADAGADITPTDDHSWRDVTFPEDVVRQDAREAVRTRKPAVVICSWPPAGNDFEQAVFETGSVELYVVVGSKARFATGNWETYEQQSAFVFGEDPSLSKLVLPPELDAAVYVFRRRAT